MLYVEKLEFTNLFEAGYISFLWSNSGVPALNVSSLDNLPIVLYMYLRLRWSYLGMVFILLLFWLVVPVIAGDTGTETAVACPFWTQLRHFMI